MEAILPARIKSLTLRILVPLVVGAGIMASQLQHSTLTRSTISDLIGKRMTGVERDIIREIDGQLNRSRQIFDHFRKGNLQPVELKKREAIFSEHNGVIRTYVGDIYYLRIEPLKESQWTLINKNLDIYFMRRMTSDLYYISFFLDLRRNFILQAVEFPFATSELQFFPRPIQLPAEELHDNPTYHQFYYHRILSGLDKHFLLEQVFSESDFAAYTAKRKRISLMLLLAVLLIYLLLLFFRRITPAHRLLKLGLLVGLCWSISIVLTLILPTDCYLPLKLFVFTHIHQVLAVALIALAAVYALRVFFRRLPPWLRLLTASALLMAAGAASRGILRGADFVFSDFLFQPQYLLLLLVLIILFSIPLIALEGKKDWIAAKKLVILIPLQIALAFTFLFCHRPLPLIAIAFAAFVVLTLLFANLPWLRLLRLALIAFCVNSFLAHHTLSEKKQFISENLKLIFSSQNHYAMLVAREIVFEINSRSKWPFSDLFGPDSDRELRGIWNATLAAREMIPSGIFVLSEKGELQHSFSDQLPFIKVNIKDRFPFWHQQEIEADLIGKKWSLALASISVYDNGKLLGDIVVQVVNSPELILRNQDETSIFTIDQKIRDGGISYIKFDQDRQILQNPANISIENLATLPQADNRWVRFTCMGVSYRGYVFRQQSNRIVIFFPEPTIFKRISEWIKIYCFILVLFLIFDLRRLRGFNWGSFYSSFSMKVFFILVTISLLAASVFTLFSLNFHFPALERQLAQAVYEKGRIARSLVQKLISEKGKISQDDIFMLSKTLDNNLMLYEDGELLYSSDNRKIIRSQVPIYLPSAVRDYLTENAEMLDMSADADGVKLYAKIYPDYVMTIEFFFNIADLSRAKNDYIDFIITLFFFIILIGISAALFFRNKILEPIKTLNRGMAEVEKGNLNPLAAIPGEIELQSLYQGFNSMIEGIKEQKKNILELARMKTLIQLSRRLAHEIKNPLTPIKLSAEQISRSLKDPTGNREATIEQSIRFIIEETEHLRKVALGFLDISKLEQLELSRFDLGELITQKLANLKPLYPHIAFSLTLPSQAVQIHADRIKINQAVVNVLNNAIEACEAVIKKRGQEKNNTRWLRQLQIGVDLQDEGRQVLISIHDNGVGMKKGDQEPLFLENYTTKEAGTGLGLIIVRRIVELHKGSLEISSQADEETIVQLRFAKDVAEA